MKFITEDELRDIYKIHPFTTYEVEPGVRLTPGARQFLADRGIRTFDDDPGFKKRSFVNIDETPVVTQKNTGFAAGAVELSENRFSTADAEAAADASADAVAGAKSIPVKSVKKTTWRERRLITEFKSVEATFLLTEDKMLKRDILLAQKLIVLSKHFSSIMKAAVSGSELPQDLEFAGCTGMNACNFAEALLDCFEITEFHMQLEKGREILLMHKLRCELQRLEPVLMETGDAVGDCERYEAVAGKINQITNSLSQMICTAVGGKECQRTS